MFFPGVNMRYVTFCFWHYCSEQRWVKIKSGQPAQQIPHLTTLWQPCTKLTFVWSGIQRAKHVQRQSNQCLLSRWIVGCPCRSCSETYGSYEPMDLLSLSLWKNSLFCTVEASGVWYWECHTSIDQMLQWQWWTEIQLFPYSGYFSWLQWSKPQTKYIVSSYQA